MILIYLNCNQICLFRFTNEAKKLLNLNNNVDVTPRTGAKASIKRNLKDEDKELPEFNIIVTVFMPSEKS